MLGLAAVLDNRTWFDLRATAKAHRAHFNTNHTKSQAQAALATVVDVGRAYRSLSKADLEALKALQAAGGMLPLHVFTAKYGEIRPYKPWRDDSPSQPWKRPISSAEKLYYLALIDVVQMGNGQPDVVVITQEVLELLPPLPRPTATPRAIPIYTPHTLCTEISLFLGVLLRHEVKLLWGRWIAPRQLKAVAALLPTSATVGRSELQSDRLRFLHYLAEIGGLVSGEGGRLLPTVAAWAWLDLPPSDQWAHLLAAWDADMGKRSARRWDFYRLPDLSREAWRAWYQTLMGSYTSGLVETLIEWANLRCPAEAITAIPEPLVWSGWLGVAGDYFSVNKALPAQPHPPQMRVTPTAIELDLSADGPSRVRVELARIATVDAEGTRLDRDALQRAAEHDLNAANVARLLAEWLGAPIDVAVYQQLAAWLAIPLTLQPLLILTSNDPQLLADLRSDRYLRGRFAGTIGHHAVAVHPHEVAELKQQLKRRGLRVNCPPHSQPLPKRLSEDAYAYLGARVYQKLGRMVGQPIKLPGAVTDGIAGRLGDDMAAWLDQTAAAVVDQVGQAMEGFAPVMGGVQQDDPAGIRAAIEAAYRERRPVTIDYFSPAEGRTTQRTITPQLPIAHHHGADYVEAWCSLAQASRTFRLDRVLRVVEDNAP